MFFLTRYTYPLLTFCAQRRIVSLVAFLLKSNIIILKNSRSACCKKILVLPKPGFNQDIEACFLEENDYLIYSLERKLVKIIYYSFLPRDMDDNNYLSDDPDICSAKIELRKFWKEVLRRLHVSFPFDAAFTGSFTYASEQEFAGALEEVGIPFIALHKECLKTPGLEPFYVNVYRTRKNRFQGRISCVYNEIEARIQKMAQITDEKNIFVTGMARMDRLHSFRRNRKAPLRPLVLFFSFNPKAGLPIIGRKIVDRFETLDNHLESLNVANLSKECHKAMVDIARENPEFRVVIKTKGDGQSLITLENIFGSDYVFPENLEIMNGGDLLQVLNESCVATGFNSTALLEAIALGVNVVVPNFNEAMDERIQPYILGLGEAAISSTSLEEYKNLIVENAMAAVGRQVPQVLDKKQAALLDHWLGNGDGKAAERVRAIVDKVITESRVN